MRWVYPSFDRDFALCEAVPDPQPANKLRAWFCPFADDPQEGVRYNEWRTAVDAFAHHAWEYRPYASGQVREDGHLVSRVWRRAGPDEHDLVTLTLSYVRWPFSATIQSSRAVGVRGGCAFLSSRSPEDFSVSTGCPENGRLVRRGR